MKKGLMICILTVSLTHLGGQDTLLQEELLPVEILSSLDREQEIIRIQRSHFLSYPASFDDPARLLMKFPGISVLNDQSNFIVYRGLPPHYSKWSLYGAEVVNTNHLSNTGTLSDRTSRSAGGVNMFSGQVIGRMEYIEPASERHNANAIAGLSNIVFRRSYRDQYFLNAGLIGLEAGMERSSGKTDFLINYRYSTLGILSRLGVDLGDETIRFQDLSSSLTLSDCFGGNLTVYGAWGNSNNDHDALEDPADYTEVKDLQDIYYQNTIGIFGVNFQKGSKEKGLSATLNFSNKNESRESDKGHNVSWNAPILPDTFRLDESLLSGRFDLNRRLFSFTQNINFYHSAIDKADPWNYWLWNSYLIFHLDVTSVLWLHPGAALVVDSWNNQWTFEPLFSVNYERWTLTARLNSMAISPELYFYSGRQKLPRIRSANFSLAYQGDKLEAEAFFQQLYKVPFYQGGDIFYSDLGNQDGNFTSNELTGSEAYIYGISAGYNYALTPSSRIKINITLLSNKSKDLTGVEFNNPYDFGHIINLLAVKSVTFSEGKYLQLAGVFHIRGGTYENPVDENISRMQGRTVYNYGHLFSERLQAYSRVDFRLNYIVKGGNSKQVVSLDIQNVTNRLNDGYHYFDHFADKVLLKKQLGIIPVLSYRREW